MKNENQECHFGQKYQNFDFSRKFADFQNFRNFQKKINENFENFENSENLKNFKNFHVFGQNGNLDFQISKCSRFFLVNRSWNSKK